MMMDLNWKLILLLMTHGIVIGVASLFGLWAWEFEPLIWLTAAVIIITVIRKAGVARAPLYAFMAGFGGYVAAIIQAIFLSTYLANNPGVEGGGEFSVGTVLGTGVFFTLLWAFFLAAATSITLRISRNRPGPERDPAIE